MIWDEGIINALTGAIFRKKYGNGSSIFAVSFSCNLGRGLNNLLVVLFILVSNRSWGFGVTVRIRLIRLTFREFVNTGTSAVIKLGTFLQI